MDVINIQYKINNIFSLSNIPFFVGFEIFFPNIQEDKNNYFLSESIKISTCEKLSNCKLV